jgi:hypothetical protein
MPWLLMCHAVDAKNLKIAARVWSFLIRPVKTPGGLPARFLAMTCALNHPGTSARADGLRGKPLGWVWSRRHLGCFHAASNNG